jgi:hypothetical protein
MPAQALRLRFGFARGDPPVSGWVKHEHLAALIARLPSNSLAKLLV